MQEELRRFKLYLLQGQGAANGKIVRRSQKTVELRLEILGRLLLACPDLFVDNIQQHLIDLHQKGKTGAYLNLFVSTLRLWGRFKETKEYEQIMFFVIDEYEASPMSDEEIQAFLNLPPPTVEKRVRNTVKSYQVTAGWDKWTMFWKLFAYHTSRPAGIAELTVDDVDWGLGVLHIKDKTGKRSLAIHHAVVDDLKAYLATLKTHYLFPSPRATKQAGTIGRQNWSLSFHARIKRLGIKRKNLTPYSLRYSSIMRQVDAGVNPFLITKMAGQKDFNRTMSYYKVSVKAMRDANKKESLGRSNLSYYERLKFVREEQRRLIEQNCESLEEEKKMLKDLSNLP